MSSTRTAVPRQWLVRFQDKTFVTNGSRYDDDKYEDDFEDDKDDDDDDDDDDEEILSHVSFSSKWPLDCLEVSCRSYPFCTVRVVSSLRGGKGGFGTLLKGQGRQSGARQTTDFGACRDLQGRRLRHVNDEIKLRKWREAQQRIQEGDQDPHDTDYLIKTPSGIYNWHLMTPSWSDLSNKATHKMQRQFQRQFQQFKSEQDQKVAAKKEKEDAYHRSIDDYVRQTNQAAQSLHVTDAVQVGLATKRKRQQHDNNNNNDAIVTDDEIGAEPNALITLSGDLVMEESKDGWKVQSQSDFATMAVVLEGVVDDTVSILYYEVVLDHTTGIAQIGWADLKSFHPSTETGDGVGDDAFSYAVDISRSLKFHASEEQSYPSPSNNNNNTVRTTNLALSTGSTVLGCSYNRKDKTVSYTLNGTDLGIAFTLNDQLLLVPAVSCNQGEILDLKLKSDQMKYLPQGAVAVHDLMKESKDSTNVVVTASKSSSSSATTIINPPDAAALNNTEPTIVVPDEKPVKKMKSASSSTTTTTTTAAISEEEVVAGPLDLNSFHTAEQLMGLGMDRLKGALLAMQCKCGGTLEERAKRLLSLKGIDRKDYPQKVRGRHFIV